LATAALVFSGMQWAPADAAETALDSVSFEWGLNDVHQGGSPAGGCNYFTAGYGDGSEATYQTVDRDLRVVKRTSSGAVTAVGKANRCAQDGANATIGQRLLFNDGEGVRTEDGSVTVHWDGALTVYAYGGLVPWYLADPVLTLDEHGDGELKVKVGGFASSMADPSVKVPLEPTEDVTVATLQDVTFDESGGAVVTPVFKGVDYYPFVADGERSTTSAIPDSAKAANPNWGSWPVPFVDFQYQTGLSSYWHTSGLTADPSKPPLPITFDLDAQTPGLAPVVVRDPGSRTVSAGADVSLEVVAAGSPAPTVSWETKSGESWVPVAGADEETLTLTEVELADDGGQYRAVITNSHGTVTSAAATLSVVAKRSVEVTSQPQDVTVKAGRTANLTVAATGSTLTYAWQRQLPGSDTWENFGADSATLSVASVQPDLDGAHFRVLVGNGVDEPVTTREASLTVTTEALQITRQPTNLTVSAGDYSSLSVQFTGAPFGTWSWEKSTDHGDTWKVVATYNTQEGSSVLPISAPKGSDTGTLYRVTGTNGIGDPVVSNVVELTVNTAPLVITTPLQNVSVGEGGTASFSAAATGAPVGSWTWETSADNGETWQVHSQQSGSNYPRLSFTNVELGLNNLKVRLKGTNEVSSVTTDPVTLTVTSAPVVLTRQPDSVTVPTGVAVSFTATASGAPMPEWVWETSTDGGTTWVEASRLAGRATASFAITPATVADHDGLRVRATATNKYGAASTQVATLHVKPRTTTRSLYVTPEIGAPATGTVITVGGDGYPNDLASGTLQVALTERGKFVSGAPLPAESRLATANVSAASLRSSDGRFNVRLAPAAELAADKAYEVVTYLAVGTNPALESTAPLTLAGQADITQNPEDASTYAGQLATFTADAIGSPTPGYRWEVSSDDGETWTTVNGATAKTLTVQATDGVDGNRYRFVATATGRGAVSAPATLTVEAVPESVQPQVQVSQTELTSTGDVQVTVTGTGFVPDYAYATRPPLAGKPGGVYVAFSRFADTWRPSQGAGSATRPTVPSALAWTVPAASLDSIGGSAGGGIVLSGDGSFETTFTVSKSAVDQATSALTSGSYGVYTYPGGGAWQPRYETYTPVTFMSPPTVTSGPSDVTTVPGQRARFSVSATGVDVTYQWQRRIGPDPWQDLPGATSAVLEVPVTSPAQDGTVYRARIGSKFGEVTSPEATLHVGKAAAAVALSLPKGIAYGAVVPATVSVTGAAGLGSPSGAVTLAVAGKVVATGTVIDGVGSLRIPGGVLGAGRHTIVTEFAGSETHDRATAATALTVNKARSRVSVSGRTTIRAGARATIRVAVTTPEAMPTGKVRIEWISTHSGRKVGITRSLKRAKLVVSSPPLRQAGRYRLRVRYLGSADVTPSDAPARKLRVR
jgi:hypothetical protein